MLPRTARHARPLSALLCLLLSCITVPAQQSTAGDVLHALRLQMTNKAYILRNFSADPVVHAHATASGVSLPETQVKSFSLVTIRKVEGAGSHIVLKGTRQYLMHGVKTRWAYSADTLPVTIDMDLDPDVGADAAPLIVSGLFYRDTETAVAALGGELALYVPDYLQPFRRKRPVSPLCDCSQHGTADCFDRSEEQGVASPKAVHHADVGAREGLSSAFTIVQILASGNIGDIWILRATNAVSEEVVIKEDRGYRFRPATCHGTPVESYVFAIVTVGRQ